MVKLVTLDISNNNMTSVETDSLPAMTLMRFTNAGNRIPCTCSFALMVSVFETECIKKTGNFVSVKTITCEQETGLLFKEESPGIVATTSEIPRTKSTESTTVDVSVVPTTTKNTTNTTANIPWADFHVTTRSNLKSKLPYAWIYVGVVVGVVLIPVLVIIAILKCTSHN